MENIELWLCLAALWLTQFKILFDMREIKQCVKIEKHMVIKKEVYIRPNK
jgi:hypothetical protein